MDGHTERPVDKKNSYRSDEEMFQFMIENSGDILWTIDLSGRWQFMTSNVEKVVHIRAKDIVGKMVWDFVAPEYREMLMDKLKRRMSGEDIPAYEVIVINGNGRRVPFEVKTSPILNKEGKIIGIQGVSRDITQRKTAEEALKKSEEELRKAYGELERRVEERTRDLAQARGTLQGILNTAPIGIIVASAPDGKITFFSPDAGKILGGPVTFNAYDPREGTYRVMRPDGSPYPVEELPLTLSLKLGQQITDAEVQIERQDGTRLILMVSSAPIRDEKGTITAAVETIVDITWLKATENELREAKAQAELYLDLMSHDINNINSMAMGYIEMAQIKVGPDKEASGLLEKSAEMLKSSSRLIGNVMKIQKAEQGNLQTEIIDLCEVIESSKTRYSSQPGRNVTINTSYPADHGCIVTANRLIEDVFANLIGNSIKHAAPGKPVKIDIAISGTREAGIEYYKVDVEDNGPGIPDELKNRLFTRLQRGKTKAAGMGLGLYLVKTLVENFRGRIWVEDRAKGNYHQGTRFVVLLPAAKGKPRAGTGACAG